MEKNSLRDYWSTDPLLHTPIFPNSISRNRFEDIMRYLHFSDNQQPADGNRLYKVQPVLDVILGASKTLYVPERSLSLDEAMVAWRGRLVFRTYNPGKLTKYGILVRAVCEASTGYMCNLKVYTAPGTKLQETILELCEPYFNKGYHMYMDNYYNSVSVAENLLAKGIRVCGTIRKTRGLPKNHVAELMRLQKGSDVICRASDVLLHSWKDKRVVNMISTIHAGVMVEVGADRNDVPVVKPRSVLEYNKYMGGVDRADQYMAYYPFMRKTLKWTKKFFMYLLMLGLFNSFIIFKRVNNQQKKLSFKKYLLEVSRSLLTFDFDANEEAFEPPPKSPKKQPSVTDPIQRLSGGMKAHNLERIPPTEFKVNASKRCKVCLKDKKRKDTRFICASCKVPLCKIPCFQNYHTKKNY